MKKKPVLFLRHKLALGDTVLFTALARDIQLNHPGKYEIVVDTHFRNLWNNNPHAKVFDKSDHGRRPRLTPIKIDYREGIRNAGRGQKIHMLSEYHRSFEKQTGLRCPVRFPKGDLHFTQEELKPMVEGRYWIVQAGGKLDMTTKFWWFDRYQQVVDVLKEQGIHCVQSGVRFTQHRHPDLTNCVNLVDQYRNERDYFNLIYHAEGFIGPITAGMHVAACFDKPCVVLAGGREDSWWEAYVNSFGAFGPQSAPVKVEHRFLHTVGKLHCCERKGCWKARVVPITPEDSTRKKEGTLCVEPRRSGDEAVGLCMDMITVDHVVGAVMGYYEDGTLPPIGEPKKKYTKDSSEEEFEMPRLVPPENVPAIIKKAQVPKVVRPPVHTPRAAQPQEKTTPKPAASMKLIHHPTIGNKFTVCVLCYGPHVELAKACLKSIFEWVPKDYLDVRVACNECSPDTIAFLDTLPITKVYINQKNRKKYPVMRDMFWDELCPITTNYVLWFDDDTRVIQPDWLGRLMEVIVANHPKGSRMFGWSMAHDLRIYAKGGHQPDRWFRTAPWFKGRNLFMRNQQTEAPNGSIIKFSVGWFWALATETIRRGDIPDRRLNHNGGDITIGEQVHQAGAKIAMFNKDKAFVWCPSRENGGRRGFSEGFPWSK
jgi:hypothetical protein